MPVPAVSEHPKGGVSNPIEHAVEHPVEHAEALPTDLPRIGSVGVLMLALVFVAILGGLFLLGYRPYRAVKAEIRADAARAGEVRPVVKTVRPRRQTQGADLVLPADIQALQDTAIYTRANGYLKKLYVDIGDRVTEGQLLAEIDTPEVDAQLNQSRAAVRQAEANIEKAETDLKLAEATWKRYGNVAAGGVSQQELDEKRAQVEQAKAGSSVARANLGAAQAEVQRLEALQHFEKVYAPFAGRITTRNYDVGALLSPGNTGAGKELFQIARTDTLRVFVKVPQHSATSIKDGQTANLVVRNYPGRTFEGKVTRSAGALDAARRTLRVQVDVANPDGLLYAGMYGKLHFKLTQDHPPLIVPSSALVYNADGLSLALLRDDKTHFEKIAVGLDFGTEMEILEGITDDDVVISNPGPLVREGVAVDVAK